MLPKISNRPTIAALSAALTAYIFAAIFQHAGLGAWSSAAAVAALVFLTFALFHNAGAYLPGQLVNLKELGMQTITGLFNRFGFEIRHFGGIKNIPDAELYRPLFEPWRDSRIAAELKMGAERSLTSLDRRYVLYVLARQVLRAVPGDFVECGVYKGGTAYLFAQLMKKETSDRNLHLFDTFGGMPEANPRYDLDLEGYFSDTSLEAVKGYLSEFSNVFAYPGLIPGTLDHVVKNKFALAHIDLDFHDPILSATNFLYDRMNPGGFIIYDDYGFASCPGARTAVDNFFAQKREIPLVLSTGQAIVFKAT